MHEEPAVSPDPELIDLPGSPRVVSRKDHCISRKQIDPDALKVMGRLIRHGYQAFLVGGGVRDLLLGRQPKDFDIGTDARPEEVRRLFRNSRVIGRRFRLIHVFFVGNKIFEVSTFRRDSEPEPEPEAELELSPDSAAESPVDAEGMQPEGEDSVFEGEASGERDVAGSMLPRTPVPGEPRSDNVYGDAESDAFRRDLTINGLFYDLRTRSVIDYVGGLDDLKARIIRTIGVPAVRFEEDPVRMIRAVRHAARTGFEIEAETEAAIKSSVQLIEQASGARVYEEMLRELQGGFALPSFQLLSKLGILNQLLPAIAERISRDGNEAEIFETLARADVMVSKKKIVPPGVLFAAVLVTGLSEEYLEQLAKEYGPTEEEDVPEQEARRRIERLAQDIIARVLVPLGVPRKDREIAESLLIARSQLIYSLSSADEGDRRARRPRLPELLPLLCELTGEGRLFRNFFRSAEFERTPVPRPRRRRRRRGPFRRDGGGANPE